MSISKEQSKAKEAPKKEQPKEKPADDTIKRIKVRLIPIWLRILIVAVLASISLFIGVVIGYSVIGDGKPADALKIETWTHIIDIVQKESEG
ncbi:DNA-directed RNA polymerase subunit beta [Siminovitchia sediminis]|uniref:DNA-directed RNA polymerase subunit beta n=1 Tax=Siminovitchia sediminis TaxID=1274353 RepID=A0ABW4KHX7_9BACI